MNIEKEILDKIYGSPKELLTLRLMSAVQTCQERISELNVIQKLIVDDKVDYCDELKAFIEQYPIAPVVIKMFETHELNKKLQEDLNSNVIPKTDSKKPKI